MLLSAERISVAGAAGAARHAEFSDRDEGRGYETYHHGKRGNTSPAIQALFDHNKYVADQEDRTNGEPCQTIVNEAIDFEGARQEQPVLMYLAFKQPHDPRVAAEKYSSFMSATRSRCLRTSSRFTPSTT